MAICERELAEDQGMIHGQIHMHVAVAGLHSL